MGRLLDSPTTAIYFTSQPYNRRHGDDERPNGVTKLDPGEGSSRGIVAMDFGMLPLQSRRVPRTFAIC